MFCTQCGKNLNPNAVVCPGCGCATGNMVNNVGATKVHPNDEGGFLWGFVGFITTWLTIILPIVLIAVWWNEYPKRARAMLKGFIAGIVASFVFGILIFVIYIGFFLLILPLLLI